ncbi:MAG: YrbL family protein [Pseudomonadota bacterium]
MTLSLSDLKPFARGGNRLCFVHPQHADRCIKIRRPDFTLEDLRRTKSFPKNLRPLSWFDDNQEEFKVMQDIAARLGEPAFALVSRCYGFEETDMGNGLTSELIRDADGRIARTLKQHIWDDGYSNALKAAVQHFGEAWAALGVPSRDLLVHNLVVQCEADGCIRRLVAIDGLGSASVIPDRWLPRSALLARSERKVDNLHERIASLLAARARNEFPGTHGLLMHDGLDVPAAPSADKDPT